MSNTTEGIFVYLDGVPTNGMWIDLDTVSDWDDIKEELAEDGFIPRDAEGKPEYGGDLLVACTEGPLSKHFHRSLSDTFDLEGFLECYEDDQDLEVKAAYMSWAGEWSREDCQDRYYGQYDSWQALADDLLDSTGDLDTIPEHLRYYFDYEAYARDIELSGDFTEEDGHYFSNN